jgi:hypothetical protein
MKIIRPMTPLHRRMLEDMQIRNYSPHTIEGYLRYVGQFAKHFGVSPDQLGPEHIRTYQLHLLQKQVSKSIFIQTVCGLRFLYETTLHRPWMVEYIPYPRKPKTLPIQAPRHPCHPLYHGVRLTALMLYRLWGKVGKAPQLLPRQHGTVCLILSHVDAVSGAWLEAVGCNTPYPHGQPPR